MPGATDAADASAYRHTGFGPGRKPGSRRRPAEIHFVPGIRGRIPSSSRLDRRCCGWSANGCCTLVAFGVWSHRSS